MSRTDCPADGDGIGGITQRPVLWPRPGNSHQRHNHISGAAGWFQHCDDRDACPAGTASRPRYCSLQQAGAGEAGASCAGRRRMNPKIRSLARHHVIVLASIFALTVLSEVKPTHAFENAHQILALIELSRTLPDDDETLDFAFVSFVTGFLKGHEVGRLGADRPLYFCIPEGTSRGETSEVIRRLVEYGANFGSGPLTPKEFLDQNSSVVVLAALMSHYPCEDSES